MFLFKADILDTARAYLARYRPGIKDYWFGGPTSSPWVEGSFVRVVVHVRRTDLVGKWAEKDGWPPTEPHYFNASMAYFRRLFKRVKFGYTKEDKR